MRSLYIHIPFCEKKCLYCDFYSVENRSSMEDFLRALEREIALAAPAGAGRRFATLFLGGGTPSLLTRDQLGRVLAAIRASFDLAPDAEVTLETNPGTVDARALEGFLELGVNRLSIGVQSFDAGELAFLSRIHDAAAAVECVQAARRAGFGNLSLDLIYALPGQTEEAWLRTLERAIALEPDHLSAYGLIVEEGTPLARMVDAGLVTPAPADAEAGFFVRTMDTLARAGYEHYEVSSYARQGRRCEHNRTYWTHGGYLGFGPSAHSFRPDGGEHGAGERWWNIRQIGGYCEALAEGRPPRSGAESLTVRERSMEELFLGLRSGGVRVDGPDAPGTGSDVLPAICAEGLAVVEGGILRLTAKGFPVCDEIALRLLTS